MQDSTLCPRQYLHAPLLCRGALCRVSHRPGKSLYSNCSHPLTKSPDKFPLCLMKVDTQKVWMRSDCSKKRTADRPTVSRSLPVSRCLATRGVFLCGVCARKCCKRKKLNRGCSRYGVRRFDEPFCYWSVPSLVESHNFLSRFGSLLI